MKSQLTPVSVSVAAQSCLFYIHSDHVMVILIIVVVLQESFDLHSTVLAQFC